MKYIYLKPVKKRVVIHKKNITIGDIADIQGDNNIVNKIKNITILNIKEDINKNYLVSVIDVIKVIQHQFDNIIVYNLGEKDTIVYYMQKPKSKNKLLDFIKVVFICLILVSGGAIAIMTFHNDAALPDVFLQFYMILLGNNNLQPYLIEIPYSIGIAVGIIVFFNHFSTVKISEDPTPIEVELRMYEKDVEDSIIETLSEEQDDSH